MNTFEATDLRLVECVVDSAAGIYAAQEFVQAYRSQIRGVEPDVLDEVERGPDYEHYYEAWLDVLDNGSVDIGGVLHAIFQAQDIFLIDESLLEDDEFMAEFVG